ncbi:MAG: hypothetical protein HOC74_37510 [Gemmatimonadetes bacterium]|jgi:hypothetical protein|nr:hypothetical protein [Gemmatimonadota bacterium]
MRTFVLLLAIVSSVVLSRAEEKIEVGEWVEFKGSISVMGQTMPIARKYAVVGEEMDEAGNRLLWLEMSLDMPGNPILAKALIPADALVKMDLASGDIIKQIKRLIVKMGDKPAVESPVEESLDVVKEFLSLHADPEGKTTELGEEEVETAKGKFTCQKRQYQGKTSTEAVQGPMVLTVKIAYDLVVWHSDSVPIIGYAKREGHAITEVSSEVPLPGGNPLPPPMNVRGQYELVGFGKGATSVLTEDPVQKPVPKLGQ